ncbi:MAG: hypothetical protein Q9226_007574 [Calogaya cf. arnoldii]
MTQITERIGDIFDFPPHSILIHACNTKGSWGAGVAAAFKKYSPAAFDYQKYHCTHISSSNTSLVNHQKSLVGTCLLIPPFPAIEYPIVSKSPKPAKPTPQQEEKQFWIACLFTSSGYGKNVDTPRAILDATERAVAGLRRQIREHREKRSQYLQIMSMHEKWAQEDPNDAELQRHIAIPEKEEKEVGGEMGECYSVRINSGLFGVPWAETKRVLRLAGVPMVVVRPASQKDDVVESSDNEDRSKEVQPESKGVEKVDGAVDRELEKVEAQGEKPDTEENDKGSLNKGLKRKNIEDCGDKVDSKKKMGGGRQTKLNFGKSK